MAARRKEAQGRFAELFSTSEDRVDDARKRFEEARTTLANARTYGTQAHADAAAQAFRDAAESYASTLRTHARLVVDYAEERAHG